MTLPNGNDGLNPNISLAFALSNDGSIPYRALLDQPTAEELLKQRIRESGGWQNAHTIAFDGLMGDPNTPLVTKIVWTLIKSITNINANVEKTVAAILNQISTNQVQFLDNIIPTLNANKITSGKFGQNMIESLIDDLAAITGSIEAAQNLLELKSATGGNLMLSGNFSNSLLERFPYGPAQIVDGYSILKAHSGVQSWRWSQLEGTHCGIYFAPTQKLDSFLVSANDVYLLEAWVYPSAQNFTPTGKFRLGCTLTDSAGGSAPTYLYKEFVIADIPLGEWTKLTHKLTIPSTSTYDTAKFYLYANNETAAGSVYWVDDVVLKEISAAQSAFDDAIEFGEDVITAGPNLIINGGFEKGWFAQLAGVYSDEQAHDGEKSLRITANGITTKKFTFLSTDNTSKALATTAGDVFYAEFWVRGKSTNTQTSGGTNAIQLVFEPLNGLGIKLEDQIVTVTASTALNGEWTQVKGRVKMPPNTTRVRISLQVTDDVNDNEVYYFDDVVVREITVAANAEDMAALNDELTKAIIESGSNLIVNSGFENGWFSQGAGTYSNDVSHSGDRSLKIVSNGITNKTYTFLSDDDQQRFIPAAGGDYFYAELYVFGKSTNTQTAPGIAGIKIIFEPFNGNTELENQVITQFTSILLSNEWTKVSGKVKMPTGTTRVRISLMVTQEVTANDTYYFDDVVVKEITAAQAAQDTADLNEDKVEAIIQTGYNLIVNPSFERGLFAQAGSSYTNEQKRTGDRSLRMISNGVDSRKYLFMSEDNNPRFIPASPGDIFYGEIWVYGKSTNTQTTGPVGIKLSFEPFNGLTELDNKVIEQVTGSALKNTWTKVSGKVTMPENTTRVRISVILTDDVPANETYYFDDVAVKEITEAQTALDLIDLNDELNQAMIQTGSNLIINGDFERGLFTQGAGLFTQEQKHSGERSLRIAASGSKKEYFLLSEESNQRFIPAAGGDIFYGEFWVYGKSTNVQSAGASAGLLLSFQPFNGNTELSNEVITQVASSALNGTWTKVSNKVVMPTGTTRVRMSLVVSAAVQNNEVYYFDDVVVKEITNAQTAQDSADLALEYGDDIVASGSNMILNPSFEKGWFAQAGSSYSEEQFRTGTRSLKIIANGSLRTYTLLSDGITSKTIKANEGNIFYAEVYVYGKTTNVQPPPGIAGIQIIFEPFNGATELDNQIISKVASTTLNGVWTKVSGLVTMPTGTKTVRVSLALTSGITSGDTYYFDDIFLKEVTEANLAQQNVQTVIDGVTEAVDGGASSGAAPTTVKGKLQSVWANLWDGLNGSASQTASGKTKSDLFTIGAAARSRAELGITNAGTAASAAATADGKAVTADGKAVTADTKAQNTIDSIVQAVDGSSTTNAVPATAKTKLQAIWNNLWDGLNGSASQTASGKVVGDLFTIGAAARSRAELGITNAGTASSAAATADGKAVKAGTRIDNYAAGGSGNLCTNPGFEDANQYLLNGVYVTSPVRTGSRAAKLTTTGGQLYIQLVSNETTGLYVTGGPSRSFYVECWVYGDMANTFTGTGSHIGIGVWGYNSSGAYVSASAGAVYASADNIGKGSWVKISGTVTVSSNSTIARLIPNIYIPTTVTAGNIYYFDDVIVRDITETQSVIDGIVQAVDGSTAVNNAASTPKTKLQAIWNNLWDGLNGSASQTATGKVVGDLFTIGSAARSRAELGITNASTADGKAVTADGKAVTADTKAQNTIDSIVQAVDGSSTTNAVPATAKTKLQAIWNNLWDGLNGSASQTATGKVVGDLFTIGSAARSRAELGVTNAATADGKAVTADGKAVTADTKAQNTIDGIIQAVDGSTTTNAVPATAKTKLQAIWNNLWDGLNGSASQTATGKVVGDLFTIGSAARSRAELGVTNASTADGKAVSAQADIVLRARDFTNLVAGLDFESTNPLDTATGFVVDTAQFRSGTKSLRIDALAAGGTQQHPTYKASQMFECKAGEQFYMELWVKKSADYANTHAGDPRFRLVRGNGANGGQTIEDINLVPAVIPTTSWTKLTLTVTVPSDATTCSQIYFVLTGPQPGTMTGSLWVDEVVVRRVVVPDVVAALPQTKVTNLTTDLSTNSTNIQNTVDYVVQAVDGGSATGATTISIKTKLQQAWANLFDGLNGTTGSTSKLPSDAYTAAAAVKSRTENAHQRVDTTNTNLFGASTGGTVITTGVVPELPQAKITNLSTDLSTNAGNIQTTVDSIVQAVDGSTGTGNAPATAKTKLQAIWNNLWDGLNGSPSQTATGKVFGDLFTIGAAARARAELGVNSAGTAQTSANTATRVGQEIMKSGSNIIRNPGFENNTAYVSGDGTISSDAGYARTGTYSLKVVSNGTNNRACYLTTNGVDSFVRIPCAPGDIFYVEAWVRGATTNTATTGSIYISCEFNVGTVSAPSYSYIASSSAPSISALNTNWVKLSGYILAPANSVTIMPMLIVGNNVANGNIFYFDDVIVREVTHSATANVALYGAGSYEASTSILTGKVPAIDGSKINTGTLAEDRIASLSAGKITSGTFGNARIATDAIGTDNIQASAVTGIKTAGLDASKITGGSMAQAQVTGLPTDLANRLDSSIYRAYISGSPSNLCTNPSFEEASGYLGSGTYNTNATYVRSGSRSAAMTGTGVDKYLELCADKTSPVYLLGAPAQKFYVEFYVRGDAANTLTGTASIITGGIWAYTTNGTYVTTSAITFLTANGIGTAGWVKASGYVSLATTSTIAFIRPLIYMTGVPSGNTYYFDDVYVEDVTEVANTNTALFNQVTPGSTILTAAVPSIDGSKINTGTLAEDRIASLSAGKIGSGTFADARIPNLAAGKITSGTFGNAFIATDAIATGNIQASAVTGAKTSGLDGSKITGGTIVESIIALLSRRKMRNTDFSNLMDDPGFENGTSAIYNGTYTIATPTGTAPDIVPIGGTKVLQLASAGAIVDVNLEPFGITVAPNETYYIEYYIRKTTTGTAGTVGVATSMGLNGTSWVSYPGLYVLMSALSQNTWLKVSGIVTVPAGANFMAIRASIRNDVPTGQTVQFDNIVVRKATATELIADSAITSSKIGAAAVTSTAIASDAVGTTQIAANAVTSTEIAANAVGTTQIASSAVGSTQLASGAVTTAKIGTGAVTTNELGSAAVTNAKVATDAIATGNIQASAVTGAKTSGLDAAKITTGQMAQAQVLNLTTDYATNNNIATTLGNDPDASGSSGALAALLKTFKDLAANTKAIQDLQTTKTSGSTKGGSWSVDFSKYASVTAAGFSLSYTGAGASTIVISNGVAQWNIADSNSRDAKLIYQTDTLTDFQAVRGTMSAPPQAPSGTTPYFYAIARVSPDGLYYVWARAYAVAFGNYKADVGYCLNGVETTWASNISLTWSLDMRFVAGVGTNAREYQIWSGNTVVYTFTESTIVSRLCSNAAHTTPSAHDTSCTKYRKWGAIAQIRNQKVAGKVESCSAADNGTPSVNGSVARMVRTATSSVSYVGGSATTALDSSFFDNIPYESLDIDGVAANGTFKVTTAKPYMISGRVHLSNNVSATGTLLLQMSANNGTSWSTVQHGNMQQHGNGEPLVGNWVQYLNANEMVRLAYVRNGITTTSLTGESTGAQTYFAIAGFEGAG